MNRNTIYHDITFYASKKYPSSRSTLFTIGKKCSKSGTYAMFSNDELARLCGLKIRSIRKQVAKLKALGAIQVEYGTGFFVFSYSGSNFGRVNTLHYVMSQKQNLAEIIGIETRNQLLKKEIGTPEMQEVMHLKWLYWNVVMLIYGMQKHCQMYGPSAVINFNGFRSLYEKYWGTYLDAIKTAYPTMIEDFLELHPVPTWSNLVRDLNTIIDKKMKVEFPEEMAQNLDPKVVKLESQGGSQSSPLSLIKVKHLVSLDVYRIFYLGKVCGDLRQRDHISATKDAENTHRGQRVKSHIKPKPVNKVIHRSSGTPPDIEEFLSSFPPDNHGEVDETQGMLFKAKKQAKKGSSGQGKAKRAPIKPHIFDVAFGICFNATDEKAVSILTKSQRGRVAQTLGVLRDAGFDLEKINEFEAKWKHHWQSRNRDGTYQRPRPEQLRELWSEFFAESTQHNTGPPEKEKQITQNLTEIMLKLRGNKQ